MTTLKDCNKFTSFEWLKQWWETYFLLPPTRYLQLTTAALSTHNALCTRCVPSSIVLTENTSGAVVTSTSFCLASRSACLDFIRSSLSIKASLALQRNRILENTTNKATKSQFKHRQPNLAMSGAIIFLIFTRTRDIFTTHRYLLLHNDRVWSRETWLSPCSIYGGVARK